MLEYDSRFRLRNLYLFGVAMALAAWAAVAVDLPVAQFCTAGRVAEWIVDPLMVCEFFGHVFGVALILLTVLVLDIGGRRGVLRLAAGVLGSGLVTDLVKSSVGRVRPKEFLETSQPILGSFIGWFPWLTNLGDLLNRTIQSFPSGHTTIAVALACGLAWRYPRGRWLFVLFAALAAAQRVVSAAHYVSDVCAGAAVGCLFVALCTDPRALGRLFDRFERASPPASVDDR